MNGRRPISVTFVCWQAMPAIFPASGTFVGGLETAAWLLARSLANLDGQADRVQIVFRSNKRDNVPVSQNVILAANYDSREWVRRDVSSTISKIRTNLISRSCFRLLWQMPYLAATWPFRNRDLISGESDNRLKQWTPDVWVAFGTSLESSAVMLTARNQKAHGVLMIQSNIDLDEQYLSNPDDRNAYGELGKNCILALRNASLILCQTEIQVQLLRERFHLTGVRLPNAIDLQPWIDARQSTTKKRNSSMPKQVLWIGRYDRFHKRPLLCLEIARRCPEFHFRMVINTMDPKVQEEVLCNQPSNVSIVDYVPFDRMMRTMSESDLFLSTGDKRYEGFPNVLLQAAATGLPIVSLEEFDRFFLRSEAGIACDGNIDLASSSIRDLLNGKRSIDSTRVMDYLVTHHTHVAIAQSLRKLFENLPISQNI